MGKNLNYYNEFANAAAGAIELEERRATTSSASGIASSFQAAILARWTSAPVSLIVSTLAVS